jgi:Flp pilus assembly CpaE family ATPase
MTMICEPDQRRSAALAPHLPAPIHAVPTLAAAAQRLAADPTEMLLIVGAGVELNGVLSLTAQLRSERPAIGVILLRDDLDIATLTNAMRAGVREVLPSNAGEELIDACRRSRELSAQTSYPVTVGAIKPVAAGRLVTVFSAKGGSGKTTLATNLAVVLNGGGTRRVSLVDLDLAFGDVAISLQLEPRRTVVDVMNGARQLDEAALASVVTPYRPNLDCILAPVQPGDAEKIPVPLIGQLLQMLAGQYEYVVIDAPSSLSEHVLAAFDASHHHVLIAAPEVPSLKNLRLTLDMLDMLSYNRDSRAVVLNRSDSKVGLTEADVERVVRSPIAGYIPSSRDVPASINRGVPLAADQPDHRVSVSIQRFAEQHLIGGRVSGGVHRRSPMKLWRRSA